MLPSPHAADQHLRILYSAMTSPLGLVIATTNPKQTKAELELARARDASLAGLRISISRTNPNAEVWVHKPEFPDA